MLSRFYISALIILAILVATSYIVTYYTLNRQVYDGTILNKSGRQRMLLHRIALLSTQLAEPDKDGWARDVMIGSIAEMQHTYKGLTKGDLAQNLPGIQTQELHDLYYKPAIQPLEEGELQSLDTMLNRFWSISEVLAFESNREVVKNHGVLVRELSNYATLLLPYLDRIVSYHAVKNSERIRDLQLLELGILITTFLTLILIARFIFRPMVHSMEQDKAALIAANEQLLRSKKQERMAALGQLSSGMSHEINNALQPIIGLGGYVREALRKAGNHQHLRYMDLMMNGALHAREILQNVRAFTHDQHVERQDYEAFGVIWEAISFAKDLLPSSLNYDVHWKPSESQIAEIYGNKTEIRQIFINLLKNASEAMGEKGTITLRATLETMPDLPSQPCIAVCVQDSGVGMDAATKDRLFDPFFTTKDVSEGTGLGLSTVYGLMKQYDGRIKVESTLHVGTLFRLYFPVKLKDK